MSRNTREDGEAGVRHVEPGALCPTRGVADATVPGGMGTFGWDDEGVVAQAVPLIKNGIFVGYLSSRETAPRIGRQSGGAMRADGWNRIPLIRMTNINLLPGPG